MPVLKTRITVSTNEAVSECAPGYVGTSLGVFASTQHVFSLSVAWKWAGCFGRQCG